MYLFFSVTQCLRGEELLLVRIPQVAFHREVFSEAMQVKMFYPRGLIHMSETGARSERNRSRTSQDFRGIVEKDFVDHPGSERRPVHRGSAFDHHTRDFELSQAAQHRMNIWPPLPAAGGSCSTRMPCASSSSFFFSSPRE